MTIPKHKDMTNLTNSDITNIENAIIETKNIIDREMRFHYDLRKDDKIEKYTNHLNNLQNMLVTRIIN